VLYIKFIYKSEVIYMKSDKYTPILEELKDIRDTEREIEGIASSLETAKVAPVYEAGGGLARLLKNMENPYIIMTAFRGEYNLGENRKRNAKLISDIRGKNLGGKAVVGNWVENEDDPNPTPVKEESFFIVWTERCGLSPDEFRQFGIELMKKYGQEAILYSDGTDVYQLSKNGKEEKIGKTVSMSVSKIGNAWSTLKGKKFVFEGTLEPVNYAHAVGMRSLGLYDYINWI
jgi:hypothetical protein